MIKLKSISRILFFIASLNICAQEQLITGVVTAEGIPLPGVTVLVKNSTNGTSTDFDGKYSMSVTKEDILVFSYVGYVAQEVVVGDKTIIDIELVEDVSLLDEIVLVGYGGIKKKDLTGPVSTVDGKELEKRNVVNIQDALQGQLAGVQVRSNGGSPGTEASITIRGFSSLNGNNPIYVVDDVVLSDISFLSPNDIENIQVLKDASTASIYGSRASNGVIIITTKKGKTNRLNITLDAYGSMQSVAKSPDLANATEYAQTINNATINDGNLPLYDTPSDFGTGTNWWDAVTQSAMLSNVAVNVNGGSEKFKLASGFSYQRQEGIVKGGGYNRLTTRLNSEYKLSDKITLRQNFSFGKRRTVEGPGLILNAQRLEPITNPYLPAYEQSSDLNEFSIFSPTITDIPNAIGQLARNFSEVDHITGLANVSFDWEIINGLTFKSQFGVYFSSFERNFFGPDYFIEPDDQRLVNFVSREHNNRTNTTWNNTLTYTKETNNHSFTLLGGIITEDQEHRTLYAQGQNTPGNDPDLRFLSAATEGFLAFGNNENYNLVSFIGRLNYSYKSKYLFTATFRADGSSIFPEDNKWGYFPSLSAAWVISDETFLKDNNTINFLKLRAGFGEVGNDNRNTAGIISSSVTTLGNDFYTLGSGQNTIVGLAPTNVGNPNLRWETVQDINIGIDTKLFNNALEINFDVYRRKTFDMIMPKQLPSFLGSGFDRQLANVGNFETKGLDLGITFRTDIYNVKSTFSLNLSHFKMTASNLADGEALFEGNHQRLDNLGWTFENQTPGQFYGYVTDGIFQNQTEINSHSDEFGNIIQPNAQPGDFRFRDLNGDGQLTDADRTIIGDPTPDFTFGFKMFFEYKNFDLNMLYTGSVGADVLNAARPYLSNGGELYNSYAGVLANSWNGEGSTNSQPRLSIDDPNANFRYSDYYIEDGSFLRLQNIQLGYNVPENFREKFGFSKARVYIGAENLFTISSFSGLEVDLGGNATLRGVDWGTYPIPRTFIAGINLGL